MQNASTRWDFIAWRRVARMCLGGMNSSGPHFQQGSTSAGTIAGLRFLGGGYLVFAVAASSAGNSYSAWIRSEANDVVAGGHVQDHWNTSYSVFARVPTAGRYWLLLQLDWEACDGVREDGLRDDSVLGLEALADDRCSCSPLRRARYAHRRAGRRPCPTGLLLACKNMAQDCPTKQAAARV